ncbi:HD-GYP domain-containing protein [Aminipila sp.]|uniref:HD-GYP domain-containing protein n=1 Tax=Aminipila sp. TaxID=2060095 RepID=UPI00289A305F|nr:HD-GYP domain-containing protein [Aminipila sp.]
MVIAMNVRCVTVIYHDLIDSIVAALEARDQYTANHSRRVSDMTEQACIALGMNEQEYENIHIAAHVHDIGKIGIPDAILMKPGKLSDEEWAYIKMHPQIGADILNKSQTLQPLSKIVLHHHESWDGGGYPSGLKKIDIPWGARIIAICDSIDAMMSDRIYRKALSSEECMNEIDKCSGRLYDPHIAKCIIRGWDKIVEPIYK